MEFLGIAFLAALPLIAVPLVLHFFDRRRRVRIEWGAMEFLRTAVVRRSKRRNLQQWLLLLARMIALTALILALAQPLAPGRWWGAGAITEMVVVLDNSASMGRTVDDRTLYEAALERLQDELDELRSEDFVRVLLTSPGPEWLVATASRKKAAGERLLRPLAERKPTPTTGNLLTSLFAATQAVPPPSVIRRKVLVISDRQAADWQLDDRRGWQRLRETLDDAPVETVMELISAASTEAESNNLAVAEVRSRATRVAVGEECHVTAVVQSFSEEPIEDVTLVWQLDGEQLDTAVIETLEPGATQQVEWTCELTEVGPRVVTCTMDGGDGLAADDANSVVIEVADGLPILVVESGLSYTEEQSDSWFITAALGHAEAAGSEWTSVFRPTVVQSQELVDVPLSDFQAVVVPALTRLPPEAVVRLAEFVRLGGGLWVGVGPRTDIGAFNQFWFRQTNGLVPVELDRLVSAATMDADHPTGINPLLDDHPAMRQLADLQRLDLGSIELAKRYRFDAPDHTRYTTLLEMVNGEPLAVEATYGRGRVILLGIPLRLQSSRLVLSRSFVVMIQEWLGWLTEPAGVDYNLVAGESFVMPLADDDPLAADGVLINPDGSRTAVAANPSYRGPTYTLRPRIPGLYQLNLESTDAPSSFHVTRPVAESELRLLDNAEREFLTETAAVSAEGALAQAPVLGARHREPLWPLLLAALLCVILIELAMSVAMSRQRAGRPVLLTARPPRPVEVARSERVA